MQLLLVRQSSVLVRAGVTHVLFKVLAENRLNQVSLLEISFVLAIVLHRAVLQYVKSADSATAVSLS